MSARRRAQSRSTVDDVAAARRVAVVRLELVDDLATGLARGPDRPGAAVGGPQQRPAVRGLTAATRVEDGPVEHDERRLAGVDRGDTRLGIARVGVAVASCSPEGSSAATRSLDGEGPDHRVGWTMQTYE